MVFEWLKRGRMPNDMVFEYHLNTGQPNYLNTGQMDAILFSYVCTGLVFEWLAYLAHMT